MKKPIFSIKNLSFFYKKNKILSINKFDLHRGAMYLFSGFMGSGKSTLMNILSKNEAINDGELFYEDQDINKISLSSYKKDIVYLDQINKRPWLGGTVKNYMLKKIKVNLKTDYQKAFKKICNMQCVFTEI